MNLCVILGAKTLVYSTTAFTLAWTHSVEKTRWEEDWRVTPQALEIVAARVEGSGAGMDPPEGAVFDGRFWRYRPKLPPQERIVLARSGKTGGAWQICFADVCHMIPEDDASSDASAILAPCP